MSTTIQNLERQLAANQEVSARLQMSQDILSKQPAIQAYQKGEISSEQYETLTSESYSTTLANKFQLDMMQMCNQIKLRVTLGLITPQEYKQITGQDYVE